MNASVAEEIRRAFAAVPHPAAEAILDVPCCPDHDALAAWLASRSWEDLAASLRAERHDPTELSSLLPAAVHYFAPAFLLQLAHDECRVADPYPLAPMPSVRDWAYAVFLKPQGWEHTARLEECCCREIVPLFSDEQLRVVRGVLEALAPCTCVDEEDRAAWRADLRHAIDVVWRRDRSGS